MAFDVHAHFVPPTLLERIAIDGGRLGVTLEPSADGPRIRFGRNSVSRPLRSEMCEMRQREAWMAEQGISVQLVSHWMDLAGYELEPVHSVSWARLVNDSLAEAVRSNPKFKAMAHVPLCDGRAAAAELERAVSKLGMSGAQIGISQTGCHLSEPDLVPLWTTASELGIPILIHPLGAASAQDIKLHLLTRYPLETTEAALQLCASGIPDRFPNLNVILIHGGGFLPYQAGRFNRGWSYTTKQLPTDYRKWFFYDSILEPALLASLGDLVGWDHVLLGSDSPFPLGDPAPATTVVEAVPPAVLKMVLTDTAGRLYGLVHEDEQERAVGPRRDDI